MYFEELIIISGSLVWTLAIILPHEYKIRAQVVCKMTRKDWWSLYIYARL